jgi:hypothetical protein
MLTHHLCKLSALAFVGLMALLLVGPVLAVVGTLLPFAIIGWLACLAFYGLRQSLRKKDMEKEISSARAALWAVGRGGKRVAERGVPWVARQVTAVRAGLHRTWQAVGQRASAVGSVLVEAVCGAVVGAMLGLIANFQAPGPNYFVLIGGLTGAAAGLGVGLLKRRALPEPQPSSRQA